MQRHSWTLKGEITCSADNYEILTNLHPKSNEFIENSELCEILQLSSIKLNISDSQSSNFEINLEQIDSNLCPRCRRFALSVNDNTTCGRCTNILNV